MENKVGILLASHGQYCLGAKDSLEMIIGPCDHLLCVSITPQMNNEEARQQMKRVYESLHQQCDEVLIFTDLLCGTPNNVAVRLMMDEEDITVMTGYNLAILVELVNRRNTTAMKVCELIEDSKEILASSLRIMNKRGEM